jgi:hypothetical protein
MMRYFSIVVKPLSKHCAVSCAFAQACDVCSMESVVNAL